MLLQRLIVLLTVHAGLCFQGALPALRMNPVGHTGAGAALSARVPVARAPIDYGVAYDPRQRPTANVCYERPWTVVEPRQEMSMLVPRTPKQRAVYESVLLLRICVDGAEVKEVQWGVQNV